jgi:hypothetical protein
MKISLLLLLVQRFIHTSIAYPNVTLTDGNLAVNIYLPRSLTNGEQAYYESSRFEHGSMIGPIRMLKGRRRRLESADHSKVHSDVLYGNDMWRVPHDPYWPESGVGLASEFGVGDDGDTCVFRCGWNGASNVINGVLGYDSARHGESFLKIGVGELIKGSCAACDSTDGYKFNSPYYFASTPRWTMYQPSVGKLILEHEAHLREYGYKIRKDISLEDDTLLITTTLTNFGNYPFSTVWYSHHFFSCDGQPIGPGYSVDLDVHTKTRRPGQILYDEPGLASWSSQLRDYAHVSPQPDSVNLDFRRHVESGSRIKAEFTKDDDSHGSFTLRGCGTEIEEDILQSSTVPPQGDIPMYGFNLYVEEGTLSPEPQVLIHLEPSHSKSWTQRLVFYDMNDSDGSWKSPESVALETAVLNIGAATGRRIRDGGIIFVLLITVVGSFAIMMVQRGSHRQYMQLPEASLVV